MSVLWAVRCLLDGRVLWGGGLANWCLGGMFLLGAFQLVPLPRPVLDLVSPGTGQLRDALLPAEHESAPGDTPQLASSLPYATISLYPGATRRQLFLLLNVFLLFGVVRNNMASPGALQRLTVVMFVNGVALALFGITQHITPLRVGGIYGVLAPVSVSFFGPFPSRNTYAYYADLCFGFGLALFALNGRFTLGDLLRNRRLLWIVAGLVVILSSILLCQSRGGVVSFLVAAGVCAVVGGVRAGAGRLAALLAVTVVGSLLVLAWLGFNPAHSRLFTLVEAEELEAAGDNRTQLWWHTLHRVRDFPVFGTGYGSFTTLQVVDWPRAMFSRYVLSVAAHNEYVEYLIVGGAVFLLLALLLIAHLLRCGYRTAGVSDPTVRALALGGLFSLASVVVNSVFNHMVRVPAVAVLTVVVCAQLDALGAPVAAALGQPAAEPRKRLACLLPVAASICIAGMGLAVLAQGWRVYTAQQYLLAAFGLKDCPARPVPVTEQIASLEVAEQLFPDNARLQLELGRAHSRAALDGTEAGVVRAQRVAAMRHFLRARDLCPLLVQAHVAIAANVDVLTRAEPRRAYLDRAKVLRREDPQLWYLCGVQELADGEKEQAIANWRRCLELSSKYLVPILERARPWLSPSDILAQVLPETPDLLVRAAAHLFPGPLSAPEQAPFLAKALRLLEERAEPLTAEDFYLKAGLQRSFRQFPEAVASYEAALSRQPTNDAWRLELARLLLDQGQKARARKELAEILRFNPGNAEVRKLLLEASR